MSLAGPFPRCSLQEDPPCPEQLARALARIKVLEKDLANSKSKVAQLKKLNKALQAQAQENLRAYKTAMAQAVRLYIMSYAYKTLFQKFLGYYGSLEEELQGWLAVRDLLGPWKQRLEFLPDDLSMASVFSIAPRDFGYSSWLDRTPDSGFIEKYIVRSHLLNGSAAQSSTNPAPFPDFLWKFSDDDTQERGLADWLLEGPPTGFPTGELALKGHMEWSRRFNLTLEAILEFIGVFRRVVWPMANHQS